MFIPFTSSLEAIPLSNSKRTLAQLWFNYSVQLHIRIWRFFGKWRQYRLLKWSAMSLRSEFSILLYPVSAYIICNWYGDWHRISMFTYTTQSCSWSQYPCPSIKKNVLSSIHSSFQRPESALHYLENRGHVSHTTLCKYITIDVTNLF
jgi:hypothetical protein